MSEEEGWDEWFSQGCPRDENGDPTLLNDPEDDPKIEAEKLDELYEQDKKQRKCAEAEAAKEEKP